MSVNDLVGQTLAGFRLTHLLGEGGMAVVYAGENVLNPAIRRAVKVVRPELSGQPEFRARFVEEAGSLHDLDHPNVVRFYGLKEEADQLVMELELLEGQPLSSVVREKGRAGTLVEVRTAVKWLLDAARGVATAHSAGRVHRDLKPDNLFLTEQGVVKVLDFGIAKALDDAERAGVQTRAGRVPGSPLYMAPEVCEGELPSRAADVYALGLTLTEVLCGHHPLNPPGEPAKSPTQLMFAHAKGAIPALSGLRLDVPAALAEIAARSVARHPTARFSDAEQLADALDAFLAGDAARVRTSLSLPALEGGREAAMGSSTTVALPKMSASATEDNAAEPVAPPRSKTPVVVGAALLVAAMAGGAYVFLQRDAAPSSPAVAAAPELAGPGVLANRWVRIEPPARRPRETPLLGVPERLADEDSAYGFRPERKVPLPSAPYEIQGHEVTWSELEAWLDENPSVEVERPDFVPAEREARAKLPATGVTWAVALDYCRDLGGGLPTEEQWEYAARGPELRPYAWGTQLLDLQRTHAYQGEDATPAPVRSSDQDKTPGLEHQLLFDLMGNAREWTSNLWREDRPGQDESWVQAAGAAYRTVRGLPLRADRPKRFPEFGAAFREPLCDGPKCAEGTAKLRATVGFRCVRAAKAERRTF